MIPGAAVHSSSTSREGETRVRQIENHDEAPFSGGHDGATQQEFKEFWPWPQVTIRRALELSLEVVQLCAVVCSGVKVCDVDVQALAAPTNSEEAG